MKSPNEPENKVTVPVNTINEQIVIAAALVSESVRDQHVMLESADRFSDSDHALIWDGIRTILQRGQGFDIQQLHTEISGKVKLEYLQQLIDRYPKPPVNMQQHISLLRWDHARKNAAEDSIPSFLRLLKDPMSSPVAVQQSADRVARSLQVKLGRSFMMSSKLIVDRHAETIRLRREGFASYPYGIPAMDRFPDGTARLIPGVAPGGVTVITGASGSGKSMLAALIALQQARYGRKVLMGAWEMGPDVTLEMMAVQSFHTPHPMGLEDPSSKAWKATWPEVKNGLISDDEYDMLKERMSKIAEWVRFFPPPFHNEPEKAYSNEDALAEIHYQVAESGCEVVLYDLWERCIPNGEPSAERRALFTQQAIHQQTNTHGILLAQQKIKEIGRTADKRPTRETVLGSSAWVEIADTMIGVYRQGTVKNIPDDSIETSILKQRHGKWPMAILHDWDINGMTIANGRDVDVDLSGSSDKTPFF